MFTGPAEVDADRAVWQPQILSKASVSFSPAEHPDRPTLLTDLEEEKERSETKEKVSQFSFSRCSYYNER